MSDADIDKAVKEAAEFEAQDKKRKEAIDTRNEADAMVFQTEKALKEVGDKLDAADKSSVELMYRRSRISLQNLHRKIHPMHRLLRSKQQKTN